MAGVTDLYPPEQADAEGRVPPAIVRGDPLVIPVTFSDEVDITAWTFRCQVRSTPNGDLIATAAVTTSGNTALITFTSEQTAQFSGGEGLDLEQLSPTHQTWWIVRALRVERDYSHG